MGEAKASGNLGNTLKVLGNFDEAIVCCQRHLDISRKLNDKVIRKLFFIEVALCFNSLFNHSVVLSES